MDSSHASIHHENHDMNAISIFGFWIYILTDLLLFSTLFCTFIVLQGGIRGYSLNNLFDLSFVFTETMFLLTSSFTCGLALLSAQRKSVNTVLIWLIITFILGAAFVGMELYEFHNLWLEGNSWDKHGALSAFFTLVGTHGLHVTIGLACLISLVVQLKMHGITKVTMRKLTVFSIFWHFLDIIWIFVFTIVYLMGAI